MPGLFSRRPLCGRLSLRMQAGDRPLFSEPFRGSTVYYIMTALWNDLRYATRMLRKAPFFTAIAVISLAAGMGANTAIFSLVDQVLLRLLPVKAPDELALLSMKGMHYGSNWGGNAISYPLYQDFRDHNEVFSGMFCRFPIPASLSFSGQTERVQAELVS